MNGTELVSVQRSKRAGCGSTLTLFLFIHRWCASFCLMRCCRASSESEQRLPLSRSCHAARPCEHWHKTTQVSGDDYGHNRERAAHFWGQNDVTTFKSHGRPILTVGPSERRVWSSRTTSDLVLSVVLASYLKTFSLNFKMEYSKRRCCMQYWFIDDPVACICVLISILFTIPLIQLHSFLFVVIYKAFIDTRKTTHRLIVLLCVYRCFKIAICLCKLKRAGVLAWRICCCLKCWFEKCRHKWKLPSH